VAEAPPTSSAPPGAESLWGSHGDKGVSTSFGHAEQKRHSPGAEQLEPVSRRCLRAAGALSLLLILVVVNSFLHSDENPLNPVAAAAERTEGVDGLRYTMTVRTSSAARQPEIDHGTGFLNLQTRLGFLHFSGFTAEGDRVKVDMVVGEDAIYLRSPELSGRLPEGREWAKMDPSLADDEDSVPAESPDGSLGLMSASDRVHLAGHSEVRGARVSRYATSFEIGDVIAGLRAKGEDELAERCEQLASQVVGPVRAEAFVDREGLLRRIHIRMASTASGQLETVDTTMDFFDFGSHPQIQIPPESLVFDMTPLLEKQQEAPGQSS
jgi:hypothetical protein